MEESWTTGNMTWNGILGLQIPFSLCHRTNRLFLSQDSAMMPPLAR